jgi:hypothetical protein
MKKLFLWTCIPAQIILLAFTMVAQDTNIVFPYYKNNFIFNSGFWVYQDTATLETDSVTLENVKHGFYGPNPAILDYREYYQLEYYSHTSDSAFNDFFVENLWRVNGGGEWAELGQPVMLANNSGPMYGGYNGFEIIEILDSLAVGDHMFYNVAWSHVYEDQQYQHEFNFDTDLYYAEDVGLVRQAYTDDEGVSHSRDLVNWEVGWITDVVEFTPPCKEMTLFPNPTRGTFNVVSNEPVRIEVSSLQGEMLTESKSSRMDLSDFADGIYISRIYTYDGRLLEVKKVIKF